MRPILFVLAAAGAVRAQHILEIPAPAGAEYPVVWAISADGSAVVGHCSISGDQRAFRWTPASGPRDLGTLPGHMQAGAYGLSADGFIAVGFSGGFGDGRAFRWTSTGGLQDLGLLPGGGRSWASAISGDGRVIAGWSGFPFIAHAFRWTETGGMQDLGTLSDSSSASAVNSDGSAIVGQSGNDTGFGRPLLWTAAAGWTFQNLGTFPGGGWAGATGVSGDGTIVIGYSNGALEGAFRWTQATGMQPLPLASGFISGDAFGISADGQTIIGNASPSVGVYRGCIWTGAGGLVDLNAYLPTVGVNLDHWVLLEGRGVSRDGRAMIGQGLLDGVYSPYVVYLDSIPCYANCDGSTQAPALTVSDFSCFLNRFAAGCP